MGLILDSNVAIDGERSGWTVSQTLDRLRSRFGEAEMGLSVVTVVELVHGAQRARDEGRRHRRDLFVNELLRDLPVYPITVEIAIRAGQIQGQRAREGISIPFEDLLIAATALDLGFGVVTANIRHFQAVPGLQVLQA